MRKWFLIVILSVIGSALSFFAVVWLARYNATNVEKQLRQKNKNNLFFKNSLTNSPTIILKTKENKTYTTSYVSQIIDGDTIELNTGERVRYIGINAPEIKHKDKKIRCLAEEAKRINAQLVLNKTVILYKDISEKDKYGRLLRYIFTIDNDVFVNDYLVRQGYAYASSFPPDVSYEKLFQEAQADAQKNERGLWSKNVCN
ncbi:MAG: thermonuclease family protein [Candidatus Nanoarchaeia archaeon]